MAGWWAKPTAERPSADVCERRFLAGKRPLAGRGTSNLGLLCHLKGIVDLDAEIANRAF
jgi:hypothetical protein